MVRICGLLGLTRQAYYQHGWYQAELSIEQDLILQEIRKIRTRHRILGGRKLYALLQPFLYEHHIKMGRDALFNLLGEHNLLIKKKRRQTITTNSRHWMRKYSNLIKDVEVNTVNQVWVSDITYLRTKSGFVYVSLITDAYSRRIMGYHVADNLESVHTVKALEMALAGAKRSEKGLIHHSDRGVQYCSREYVKVLQDYNVQISMTENGDPLENPLAERVNGIIKNEYLYEQEVQDRQHAEHLLQRDVPLYNTERPHLSLGMHTPESIYQNNLPVQRLWKNYYLNKLLELKSNSEKL